VPPYHPSHPSFTGGHPGHDNLSVFAFFIDSLTLSTLLCSMQSAGIVLGVIALFIGLIISMMICGVVRLEHDSLRVLVS
jgi:hypothetical protein